MLQYYILSEFQFAEIRPDFIYGSFFVSSISFYPSTSSTDNRKTFMPFLGKGKKADLIKLAIEMGECESDGEELKIIELRAKILTNDAYKEDPEFVKCIFEGIISNRIDEENEQKEQTLQEFELQKIRLQNETQRFIGPQSLPQTKIELKKLLPTLNPEVDNMDPFLTLFERQMKLWILVKICGYPISLVPYRVM
ncbi:uncharacterized protein TNCV_1220742 [Trichonephila clavipes]|nr:uncharacterized protein TNCV_1220741 [Trichonephila clavipes]GFW36744.1 uncharacterized protein TNCV_1220742 [Trichonephila clavipes]